MMVAHKIALDLNRTQRSYFARASGTARFAYNWALGAWKKQSQAGGKPSEICLRRQLNALKREQYRWMFDVTKWCRKPLSTLAQRSGRCLRRDV